MVTDLDGIAFRGARARTELHVIRLQELVTAQLDGRENIVMRRVPQEHMA